jgi:hypothetical protein
LFKKNILIKENDRLKVNKNKTKHIVALYPEEGATAVY